MNSTMPSPLQRLDHLNPQFPSKEGDRGMNAVLSCSKGEAYINNTNKIVKFFWKKPEHIEKILKNTNRFLEILAKVQRIANPGLIALAASFKNATDVLESLRFIGVLKIFLTLSNGKYFLFDPKVSFQKKSDRVLLLGHTGCKALRALNKWTLIDLGIIGKCKIGSHLTCFHFVTDSLMIASSFFGLWDNFFIFRNKFVSLTELNRKLTKLERRPLSLGVVLSGDQEEIRRFQIRYEAKVKHIRQQIELKRQTLLDSQLANEIGKIQEIEVLEKKLSKNENRLQKLNSLDYTAFVKELSEKNILGKLENVRERKRNCSNQLTKDIVRVASSISKIFVIALALLLTAVNITSTIPVVALLACGIIADSIGLTKIYIENGPLWKSTVRSSG